MKIHLIRKETISTYASQHSSGRVSFDEWMVKLKYADWNSPADISRTFPSADLIGNGSQRVVFDIGGNKYRMICKYAFGDQQIHLFVCWIGTHAAYTRLCNAGKQYIVSDY